MSRIKRGARGVGVGGGGYDLREEGGGGYDLREEGGGAHLREEGGAGSDTQGRSCAEAKKTLGFEAGGWANG